MYFNILRHSSLQLYLTYACLKLESFIWNSEGNIHIQKYFEKNQISEFPPHYFCEFSMYVHLLYIIIYLIIYLYIYIYIYVYILQQR